MTDPTDTAPDRRGTARRRRIVRLTLAAFLGVLGVAACVPSGRGATEPCCPHEHERGYGRCSSCNCRAFEGNSNTCANCGHNYGRHY